MIPRAKPDGHLTRRANCQLNHASSGPPEWPAGLPKGVFTRDSDVIQQPIVQRAQVLPSLLAK
jgi:hypothetical protein